VRTRFVILAVLALGLLGTASVDRAARADPPGLGVWVAPVQELVLVHPFDPPEHRWSAGHRGVDLVADAGTSVLAPCDGVVTFVGPVAGRPVLTVLSREGLRSSVEPVEATVGVGDLVRAGDAVGVVVANPASHCAPTTCLHWGVRRGTIYIDPMSLLAGGGPVVLLPQP